MRTTHRYSAICCIIALASGCRSPYIIWPNFAHPGPASYQRAVADKFDPYPSPDEGPPIVGGRPIGYTRPYTETEWGRRYARPDGPAPPPAMPFLTSAPPVITGAPPSPPQVIITPAATSTPNNPFTIQPRAPY